MEDDIEFPHVLCKGLASFSMSLVKRRLLSLSLSNPCIPVDV